MIEHAPYPMALWSLDRRCCVFNDLARQVLGCCEEEVSGRAELYINRIHPHDRPEYLTAWKKLQDGDRSVSCRYRFTPGDAVDRIVRETSLLFSMPVDSGLGAMTLYAEERKNARGVVEADEVHKLMRGFVHEMGNNLQAISGELELLRWSGALPTESAAIVSSGILQIRNLGHDLQDYFFSFSGARTDDDIGTIVAELMQSREQQTTGSGIRVAVAVREALPRAKLSPQFAKALTAIVDFCIALLDAGGELKIEAGTIPRDGGDLIQLHVIACGFRPWSVDGGDVFRPFINVSGYRTGLRMAAAQRILRRHSAKIVFRKEQPNRGIFSILIPAADLSPNADAFD